MALTLKDCDLSDLFRYNNVIVLLLNETLFSKANSLRRLLSNINKKIFYKTNSYLLYKTLSLINNSFNKIFTIN